MSWLRFAVASSLILGGCVGEEQVELETVLKPVPGDDTGCPDWGCGSNSPEIDSLGFHDLHELGIPNKQGFYIVGFHNGPNTITYTPDVRNGELFAYRSDGTMLNGLSVAGLVIDIKNVNTGLSYYVRINAVERMNFWAVPPAGPAGTYAYILYWQVVGASPTQWAPLCRNPNSSLPEDGLSGFKSVLFDDDRIDADSITVTKPEANWFNIGCGGHALSKQHLTGHTKAAGMRLGITTTLAQRTANLKMIAGDYCGSGDPFTVAGQKLRWRDENNWYNTTTTTTSLEARWTETGASCLNKPRIDANMTPAGMMQFPGGVESFIAATCRRPPTCQNTSISFMDGKHVLSANPP